MPEPRFTDTPGVVDLVYHIEEGEQYLLGRININGNDRTRAKVILRELSAAGLLPGEPLDGKRMETAKKRLANLKYFIADPQQGDPIKLQITNRRGPDQPYGELDMPELDDLVRGPLPGPRRRGPARPSPGEAPDLAAAAPAAAERLRAAGARRRPGVGRAVRLGRGLRAGADTIPPIDVPPPIAQPVSPGAGGSPVYPPPSDSPPGTFPTTARHELLRRRPRPPGAVRRTARSPTSPRRSSRGAGPSPTSTSQVQEAPTGRVLLGVGATSYGGLNGNFIIHERNFDIFNVPRSFRELLNGQAFRGAGQEFRLELSPGTLINRAVVSFREPDLFNRRIGLNVSGYTFSRYYPPIALQRGPRRRPVLARQAVRHADLRRRRGPGRGRARSTGFEHAGPGRVLRGARPHLPDDDPPEHPLRQPQRPVPAEQRLVPRVRLRAGLRHLHLPEVHRRGPPALHDPPATGQDRQAHPQHPRLLRRHRPDTPLYERFYAGDFRSLRGFAYRGVGPHSPRGSTSAASSRCSARSSTSSR